MFVVIESSSAKTEANWYGARSVEPQKVRARPKTSSKTFLGLMGILG